MSRADFEKNYFLDLKNLLKEHLHYTDW